MTEPWVCPEDVAKHLGVVIETIYRWIDSKGPPAVRVGGAAEANDGDGGR